MKNIKKLKSFGALILAMAAVTSISVSAFAQEPKTVTMHKIILSSEASATIENQNVKNNGKLVGEVTPRTATTVAAVPQVNLIPASEALTQAILTRTNEKTGKLEISKDNGKSWTEFDGKAIALTPAQVGVRP